jgi:hypothetical protein
MWFRFEERVVNGMLSQRNMRRQDIEKAFLRIRQVFSDGLRFLPGVKAWVLLGLHFFDREDEWAWPRSELKGVYEVMNERELRIRVEGLEDLLVGAK